MNVSIRGFFVAAALMSLFSPAHGQMRRVEPPSGPAPRLANGKPDFSGVWQSPRMADVTQDMPCCKGVKELPFTPWGKQQWDSYDAARGDYTGSCLPFGLLRSVGGPHPCSSSRTVGST